MAHAHLALPFAPAPARTPRVLVTRAGRMLLAAAVTTASLSVARTAQASSDFPSIVAKQWNIGGRLAGASAQGCTLCHKNDDGGFGTVNRAFGVTLRTRLHVIGGEPDSLRSALDYDKSHALDSDGDKISDWQELAIDHTSPNDPNDFKLPPAPPPDAGTAGEGGQSSTSSDGGRGSSNEPPPYAPAPDGDLPPPFEHGCAFVRHSVTGGLTTSFTLAVAACAARYFRRRRGLNAIAERSG